MKEFAPGEIIIKEGSVNDDLYFIPKGKVEVALEVSSVRERQLTTIEGPIVLEEISFLDKSPRIITPGPGVQTG